MLSFVSVTNASYIFTAIGVAVVLRAILRWLFAPRLNDSDVPVNESLFYTLKCVGKHSKDIPLDDVANTVAEMKRVYRSNYTRPVSSRIRALKQLLRLLDENEDAICEAVAADLGRCKLLAASYDVYPLRGEIKKFIKHVGEWSRPQPMGVSLLTFPSYDCHVVEPHGTVYVNGIWNFPFQLAISPIAGAIAAGNNVIFKPCNTAKNCALLLSDLLHKYVDKKFVQVIGHPSIADGDDYVITNKLLDNRFDMIFFTGSSNGGKYFMERASKFLTPVILELGGKNPVIVDDTANLELAAKQVVSARMVNCGQQCISPDYVLCYKSCVDAFVEQCVKCASKWYKTGATLREDLAGSQSKMINLKQLKRCQQLLASTQGKIMYGGKCDEETLMFEPTIVQLKNINQLQSEPTMKHETFGPILWIVPINNDVKEAATYINENMEKSLSLYMFSSNTANQRYVMHNTSSGGMQINGVVVYAAHGESRFGGVGHSGMGFYHGKHSFDAFSHYKPCVKSYLEMPLVYPPYDAAWKRKVFKMVF